jgi:hypothetical protein
MREEVEHTKRRKPSGLPSGTCSGRAVVAARETVNPQIPSVSTWKLLIGINEDKIGRTLHHHIVSYPENTRKLNSTIFFTCQQLNSDKICPLLLSSNGPDLCSFLPLVPLSPGTERGPRKI